MLITFGKGQLFMWGGRCERCRTGRQAPLAETPFRQSGRIRRRHIENLAYYRRSAKQSAPSLVAPQKNPARTGGVKRRRRQPSFRMARSDFLSIATFDLLQTLCVTRLPLPRSACSFGHIYSHLVPRGRETWHKKPHCKKQWGKQVEVIVSVDTSSTKLRIF